MYQASVPVFRHYLSRVSDIVAVAGPDALDARIADSFPARQLTADADSAEVAVSFTNFGKPTQLRYSLVREASGWRVDDVAGTWDSGPWTVRDMLGAP